MAKAYEYSVTMKSKAVHTYTVHDKEFAERMFKVSKRQFKRKDTDIESITELVEIEIPDEEV